MTNDLVASVRSALARAGAVRPKVNGFPYFAEALREAAITAIETSIAAGGSVYHLTGGSVAQPFEPIAETAVAVPNWDETALIAAIRADQAGRSTFPEFLRAAWNAGVIGYRVDLTERTCTYAGTATRTYVETYPAVTLTDRAASLRDSAP